MLKASVEGEVWGFPVEVGFETQPRFLVMEVTLGTIKLPDFELDGTTISGEIEGTIQFEMGPSKALLARAAVATGLTAVEAAAAGGVLVVTAVIIGGTIYASESAKQQFAALVVETALRDGAASRIAFEALGADARVLTLYRAHRLELMRVGREPSREGFERGQAIVAAYLDSLRDERDATIKSWTEKYAKGKNAEDFDKLREQLLFEQFDAYKNDRRAVEEVIAQL